MALQTRDRTTQFTDKADLWLQMFTVIVLLDVGSNVIEKYEITGGIQISYI